MANRVEDNNAGLETDVIFVGFALNDCVVEVDQRSAKYLRPVHRSALELSVHNRFGLEIGGFWLMPDQIDQLRQLSSYYPANETPLVASAVEAYLRAQLQELYWIAKPPCEPDKNGRPGGL